MLPPAYPDFRAQDRFSGSTRALYGRRMRSNRVDARAGVRTHRSLTVSRSHSKAVVSMSASVSFLSRTDDLHDGSIHPTWRHHGRKAASPFGGVRSADLEYCDPVNLSRLHLAGVNRQVVSAAGAGWGDRAALSDRVEARIPICAGRPRGESRDRSTAQKLYGLHSLQISHFCSTSAPNARLTGCALNYDLTVAVKHDMTKGCFNTMDARAGTPRSHRILPSQSGLWYPPFA